ncbi:ABC transporter permease [Oceanobacter antarcticus]|uniref:Transport permease protein n=1 Tax=Oceanobacter antarcticus TaxID=3133425 RepID=A0ABW8NGG6_9GAMM
MERRRKRSPLQIMQDTVYALFIRELRTRFGGSRLGYFWAIAEPAGQAAIMAGIFSLLGRSSISGVEVGLFMVTSLLTFKLFNKILTQTANAVQANKGLMSYRQVEPIDPVITRVIIELVTYICVLFLLCVLMAWVLGYEVLPAFPLQLIGAIGLLTLLSLGIGLLLCSLVEYWADTPKLLTVVMTPMLFVSGVFYPASVVPKHYWYLINWNPVFHCLELMREAYFDVYYAGFGSWTYVISLTLLFLSLSLSLYHVNRSRFIGG